MPVWLLTASLLATNPMLVQGEEQFRALEFKAAVETLRLAVAVPDQTEDERRAAHDLLAQSLLALNRPGEAQDTYRALLQTDANAPIPSGSPKVRETFARAKEQLYPKPGVSLRALPAAAGSLIIELQDPWVLVRRVRLIEPGLPTRDLPRPENRLLKLPSSSQLEVEAFDDRDVVLAKLRVDATEVQLQTSMTSSSHRAAPWVLGGSAIAAGIVAAVLLGLAFAAPSPSLTASDASAYNTRSRGEAIAGWSLLGVGVALGVTATVVGTF